VNGQVGYSNRELITGSHRNYLGSVPDKGSSVTRLMFIKAGRYAATSTHTDYYNGVVNSEANNVAGLAALGTTWLDIGSTASVRATWHMLL